MILFLNPTLGLDSGKRTGLEELGLSGLAVAMAMDKCMEEWQSRKSRKRTSRKQYEKNRSTAPQGPREVLKSGQY